MSTIESPIVTIPGYVAGTWKLDPIHTHIGFSAKHMMVAKVRGRFTEFEGTIVTAPDPLASTAVVTIQASSIDTNQEFRDNHIRSADFFDADNHPTITFALHRLRPHDDGFAVEGELTMRGITKPITLTMDTPAIAPTGDGSTKAGFSMTGDIDRHAWGVSYDGPIPGGGTMIGSRVQLVLDVEADLQPA
ncbi:MAG: YceI family protein [Chloroflexota bacterium]